MQLNLNLKKMRFVICSLLLLLCTQVFPQSRINVDKVVQPRKNRAVQDSVNLFKNSYIDTSLFPVLRDTTVKKLSVNDSLRVNDLLLNFRRNYTDYSKIQNGSQIPEQKTLLRNIINDLEQALRLKSGDRTLRRYLAFFYGKIYSLYTEKSDSLKLIQLNTNFTFLTSPKTHFSRYLLLAQHYMKLKETQLALKAYKRVVENIFEFYSDSLNNGRQIYSNYLFSALNGRATCEENLFLDGLALRSRQHSLVVAPQNYKKGIEGIIKNKLLWDGGNLKAYSKRQEGLKLMSEKKYREARQAFIDLLPMLDTRAAEIEIQKYIAQNELFSGDSYSALERMHAIVNHFPFESPQFDSTEVDSVYHTYLELYAQMCLGQGYREFQVQRLRQAFIYFSKAGELQTRFQAQACFMVARLLLVKNSVVHADQVIEFGLKAWNNEIEPLTVNYKKQLANFLYRAYQQKGDFALATEWFQRSHTIEN